MHWKARQLHFDCFLEEKEEGEEEEEEEKDEDEKAE